MENIIMKNILAAADAKNCCLIICLLFLYQCSSGGITISKDADGANLDSFKFDHSVADAFNEEINIGDEQNQPDTDEFSGDFIDGQITPSDIEIMETDESDSSLFTPCQYGNECPLGFCVDSPDGKKVCAISCTYEPCPEGWECKSVTIAGGDTIFICLTQFKILCMPCMTQNNCWPSNTVTNDICVDYGNGVGKYCGIDCGKNNSCPDGYECKQVDAGSGKKSKQCVLSVGECICTDQFTGMGAKTSCYKENTYGKCTGERLCGKEGLTDCDAKEPEEEKCDGKDNNCDGTTDENIKAGECSKKVGELICKGPEVCEGGKPVCKASDPSPEKCDGIDNDCDGTTDPENAEGCVNYYQDSDNDTYGDESVFKCLCGAAAPFSALVKGDCDDSDKTVNPAAPEKCNDKDDNCNGEIDEKDATGCTIYHLDEDGDGYGTPGDTKCLCKAQGKYTATQGSDCNDSDKDINPGAKEICDQKDNNCDKLVDGENSGNCTMYYFDGDGDGYGANNDSRCLCAPEGKYNAVKTNDCNDSDFNINPGVPEKCNNNKDDNCNGQVDEAGAVMCTTYYADKDGDGYGDGSDYKCLCAPAMPYIVQQTIFDCNDYDKTIYPNATEKCNQKDDDCDASVDEEGAQGCAYYYLDNDGDGWGINNSKCLCGKWGNYTATQITDCNDSDNSIYPTAPEKCDGKDNNCVNGVDEGENGANCKTYYYDNDGDGYGLTSNSKCLCNQSGKYSALTGGDCSDYDGSIHPNAPEKCNNIDDNCINGIDEGENNSGCTNFYYDGDNDTYGTSTAKCLCKGADPYDATKAGDCNDTKANAYPGASEICDYVDNDCDTKTDEGFYDSDYNGADLSNNWAGPNMSSCESGNCSGSFNNGRLLPSGDIDWMRIYKKETNNLPVSLRGKVTFYGAAESNKWYIVCICYSQTSLCDQSSQQCATSIAGSGVTVEVENGDSWGSDDSAYLDIQIKPDIASIDYSCSKYSLTWSVWE
jgi:hypothetical protein